MKSEKIIKQLFESDSASALTNQAARHIEEQDKVIEKLKAELLHLCYNPESKDSALALLTSLED